MTKEKVDSTPAIKELLSAQIGGEAKDWKRTSRDKVIWNDIDRKFENTKTGEIVIVSERSDGLLCVERGNGEKITARLSAAFNAFAKPSVVDTVLNMILTEEHEIDDALYAQAVKYGLVKRFSFCIAEMDMGDEELTRFAVIYPTVRDATFCAAAYIQPLVPALYSEDACVEDMWRFEGEETSSPAKLARYLAEQGLEFDEHAQRNFPEVYAEAAQAAAAVQRPGLKVETDLKKIKTADKIMRIVEGKDPGVDEDTATEQIEEGGVPSAMVKEAGVALANRYCFAIQTEEYDGDRSIRAMITPIRFFEEHGHCDDQNGPISPLLPRRVVNDMEATWGFYDDAVKTPLDAARVLQAHGFVWNKEFQAFIDGSSDVKTLPLLAGFEGNIEKTYETEPRSFEASIEKDPAKVTAAQEVMDNFYDEPSRRLIKSAGKALANRFSFGVMQDEEGGLCAIFTPEVDGDYDGDISHFIGHLVSSDDEQVACTFGFYDHKDALDLVSDLTSRGFILERGLQEQLDEDTSGPKILPLIEAEEKRTIQAAPKSKAKSPKR